MKAKEFLSRMEEESRAREIEVQKADQAEAQYFKELSDLVEKNPPFTPRSRRH